MCRHGRGIDPFSRHGPRQICEFRPSSHIREGSFVLRSLIASLSLAAVVLSAPVGAQAQTSAKPAMDTGPAAIQGLTPDQARQAIDTLQNDAKRREVINVLKAISEAKPQAVSGNRARPPPTARLQQTSLHREARQLTRPRQLMALRPKRHPTSRRESPRRRSPRLRQSR